MTNVRGWGVFCLKEIRYGSCIKQTVVTVNLLLQHKKRYFYLVFIIIINITNI